MDLEQINQGNIEQVPFGDIHHDLACILPNASEIGHLWSSYLAENMSVCMLKFMVAKSKDPDIKPILQQALDVSSQRVKSMEDLFKAINHPIPEGFGEKDVDNSAPELYSENFSLSYTRLMHNYIGVNYMWALSRCSRLDFRLFFSEGINTSREIIQKASDVLLAKGLLMKAPHVIIPDMIEKVNNKEYYGSLLGSKRPLNAVEVSHVYHNMEIKLILATLKLGFSQVAKSQKVKKLMFRGYQIHNQQAKNLANILEDEMLPTPSCRFSGN